jgi:ABC-type glycerol-3-phosphate transport system substrate-binding protein
MKKLVSRLMAVLMAMTMILSMSMTAFAAEAPKGTLTVNNTVAGKEQNRRVEISFLEIPGEKY